MPTNFVVENETTKQPKVDKALLIPNLSYSIGSNPLFK
jgi:hypothetical protein